MIDVYFEGESVIVIHSILLNAYGKDERCKTVRRLVSRVNGSSREKENFTILTRLAATD